MTINERVSPKRLAEIIARAEVCDDSVLTDYRDIESIARELQQYRAAAEPVCPKCGGTGMADSGGFQPWGEPILIECDCQAAPQVTSVPVVTLPSTRLWAGVTECYEKSDVIAAIRAAGAEVSNDD
ncbi:hypothetical protein [Atlantibacter hermannii]|uniref:hypothetical protein n=1 Tax=Atlantibacter hermannii TaxID=565 RepID=UPI0028A229A2|nr:hypothetical protein [Atlantibacter hermannii]